MAGLDRESTTGPPRWVRITGIIAAVVILLLVILLLTSGPGGHGPSRHTPSGGFGQMPATSIAERGL
jgi:hypothetical protein